MTAVEELERRLIAKLRTRGTITARGCRLEAHIAPMIGLGKNQTGHAAAAGLLQRLEKERKVSIDRDRKDDTMREVTLATIDPRTSRKPKEDYMSEPTELAETSEADEATPEIVMTKAEAVKLTRVNKALLALQANTDSNGEIKGASGPIIMKELGVPKHIAADLNALLTELNLRKMSGPRNALVHIVSTEETVISIEQLRVAEAARVSRNKKKKTQKHMSESNERKPAVSTVATETPEATSSVVSEKSSEGHSAVTKDEKAVGEQEDSVGIQKPMLEQLADAVIELRAQIKARDETIDSLNERLRKGGEEAGAIILRLKNDLEIAKTDNGRMTQLLRRVGAPSARVEKLLTELAT